MSLSRFFHGSISPSARDLMGSRLFRLFDDPIFNSSFPSPLMGTLDTADIMRTPTFDVKETDKEFLLQGELPGVERKNLDLQFIDPQTLSIKGRIEKLQEYKEPKEPKEPVEQENVSGANEGGQSSQVVSQDTVHENARYWASERVQGEFSRAFRFPSRVNPDNVSASLRNGILNIKVPKIEEDPPRKIQVIEE